MIKKLVFSFAALMALMAPQAGAQTEVTAEEAAADPTTWREVDSDRLILMKTTKGDVLIELAPEFAPRHTEQVTRLARSGLYGGTAFHRVIRNFMAQGGDISAAHGNEAGLPPIPAEFTFRRDPLSVPVTPVALKNATSQMYGGFYMGFPVMTMQEARSDYSFDNKVESWMPHCPGVVSMARTSDPNSALDQFFLVRGDARFLDRQYTAWGRMLSGLEVARALNVGEPPRRPDQLVSVSLVGDMASAERPRAWVMRNNTPAFAAFLEGVGRKKDICDLPSAPTLVVMP